MLFSALVLGGASTFVSCKDTESDAAYENLAGTNKNIAQLIAQQAKDVEELTRKLEAIKSYSCTDEKTKQLIEDQIKTSQNIIQELKRQLTNNITNDVDVQNAILNLTKGSIEEGQLNETIKKLIPAYLKEISVDGGATLTAAGQSGSKVVLKSGQYKVGFNATKAGVYTIKYSAVDYFGNTVTKEFFVKVVD